MIRPAVWVFGYGSLVSPDSLAGTLGRPVDVHGPGWTEADLHGWTRAWNYGIGHWEGVDPAGGGPWTLLALGLVADPVASVNGILVAVTAEEVARLDRRERDYDRVEVTASVRPDRDVDLGPGAVVYVPRPTAVERAAQAVARGRAAVEQRYHDLVEDAFAALGPDRLARYRATTRPAGVPVRDLVRVPRD